MKYSVAWATEFKRNSNSHFIRDRILLLILQELCVNPSDDYRYDPKQKRNLQWRTRLHLVTKSWSSSSSSWSPFDEPKCRKKKFTENSKKRARSETKIEGSKIEHLARSYWTKNRHFWREDPASATAAERPPETQRSDEHFTDLEKWFNGVCLPRIIGV